MKTPDRISIADYLQQLAEFLQNDCIGMRDGGESLGRCKKCGAAIERLDAYVSLHDARFPECTGTGSVRRIPVLYCPSCEETPSLQGCFHDEPEFIVQFAAVLRRLHPGHPQN